MRQTGRESSVGNRVIREYFVWDAKFRREIAVSLACVRYFRFASGIWLFCLHGFCVSLRFAFPLIYLGCVSTKCIID